MVGKVYGLNAEQADIASELSTRRFKSMLPGGTANRHIVRSWEVVTEGLGIDEKIDEMVAAVN